jgi:hypothetical protein
MTRNQSRSKHSASVSPPADLPTDPKTFWSPLRDLNEIEPPPKLETPPTLQQLGPLPINGSSFPMMGFLASIYEHVSSHVGKVAGSQRPESGQEDDPA